MPKLFALLLSACCLPWGCAADTDTAPEGRCGGDVPSSNEDVGSELDPLAAENTLERTEAELIAAGRADADFDALLAGGDGTPFAALDTLRAQAIQEVASAQGLPPPAQQAPQAAAESCGSAATGFARQALSTPADHATMLAIGMLDQLAQQLPFEGSLPITPFTKESSEALGTATEDPPIPWTG